MRVLIVEDDSMFNQFYAMYAQMQGDDYIAVTSLAAAQQALTAQSTTPFDAVLLDNHLTDGQGLSLLPTLAQLSADSAVIMVSANDEPEFFLEAFEKGVDDYAVKPVNMDLLWVKLRRSVQQRRLRKQARQQQDELELWIDEEQKEQRLANHIFNSMTQHLQANAEFFRSHVQSSATFCGDVVLRQQACDGSWYFLLADSMGHGLAAAVSLIPTLEVFQAMSRKALPLSNIVYELNHKLSRQLPADRFVAAVLMRLDPNKQSVEIWNGAMPPLLLVDIEGGRTEFVRSSNMALGILDDRQVEVETEHFMLSDFDLLVAYSDGVIESELREGGYLNVRQLSQLWQTDPTHAFSTLQRTIESFTHVQDDITAIEINLHQFRLDQQLCLNRQLSESAFSVDYCIRGAHLASADIGGVITSMLTDAGVSQQLCGRAFAVLTELFLNAYEHGVLKLDSAIKQADDGFLLFYEEKDRRSQQLAISDFVQMKLSWNSTDGQLLIEVADSGAGFDVKRQQIDRQEHYHGRGLQLVSNLATKLSFNEFGNQIKVVMNG